MINHPFGHNTKKRKGAKRMQSSRWSDELAKLVGSRLRILRYEAGLKQTDIAKMLGVNQSTYSDYEGAVTKIPLKALIQLSDYYNVSLDYLLAKTDNRN